MNASAARVRCAIDDGIAILEIDHPPVNALAQPLRASLLEQLLAAESNASVRAIVIVGAGRQFVAGADLREFDAAPLAPLLNDLLVRVEACSKPVIAALHGATLGGGLELALACHYRCATDDLSWGFPEIKLGLLPGAGGTQRLPRIVGPDVALELMLSGNPQNLAKALELGVVDRRIANGAGSQRSARACSLPASSSIAWKLRSSCHLPRAWPWRGVVSKSAASRCPRAA